MNAEQLQETENQGRRFAKALFDAGFDAQMVEDAAFVPVVRLNKTPGDVMLSVNMLLAPSVSSTVARQERNKGCMFFAGVMSEIEERRGSTP